MWIEDPTFPDSGMPLYQLIVDMDQEKTDTKIASPQEY